MYGIMPAKAAALLDLQDGLCPLCLEQLSLDESHVDHDHDHGCHHRRVVQLGCPDCVRGLTHPRCNGKLAGIEAGIAKRLVLATPRLEAYLASRPLRQMPLLEEGALPLAWGLVDTHVTTEEGDVA